ncbi:MAG TPA: hydroxyisourate hydrolase [Thermoanaerobaculia bacterium]|nr:hydroxyisourate hydrolase [Thermoanaerobaculia bacterium]
MSGLSTHILDLARGRPAAGVTVVLARLTGGDWKEVGRGDTDADGRVSRLLPEGAPLERGTYRLLFDTGGYFRARGREPFYPEVTVVFAVSDPASHHHVPLLLSPYGYSTYRGS